MKNTFLLLLLFTGIVKGQIVNIPDAVFKNRLVNTLTVDIDGDQFADADADTNNDGEISFSEALAVTSLLVGRANISDPLINDLTGIEAFTNLTHLSCYGNNLTTLDTSAFTNLTSLEFFGNHLTSLNTATLTNLTYLNCSGNDYTSLDLTGLTHLNQLDCTDNPQLTSVNLANLVTLTRILISGNQLTSLDVSTLTNLTSLNCLANPISAINFGSISNLTYLNYRATNVMTIDLSSLVNLITLECSGQELNLNLTALTQLQSLTTYGGNYDLLDLSANTNLNEVWVSGQLNQLLLKNGRNETVHLQGTSNLTFICADETQIQAIQTEVIATANPSTVVSSYCSFTPGGNFNTITGNTLFDIDNNGCDVNDTPQPYLKMKITDTSNTGYATTNTTGNYSFYTVAGTFTVQPELEHPSYFSVSPATANVGFQFNDNSVSTQNFCITANGVHPDLAVVLVPISTAQPGFDATYKIILTNNGTEIMSESLILNYDGFRTTFSTATPVVTTQEANNLTWDFVELRPFETRTFYFTLHLNSTTDIPALNAGDILNFNALCLPVGGDENSDDNTFEFRQNVVNSQDPNFKTCLEGETIAIDNIGKFLHYNIDFENIGTNEAHNIVVRDEIDTSKYDVSSMQMLDNSHPSEVKVTGNVVEFIFKNINLPSSISNPIGGHGNVLFKIKALPTLQVGDVVANTANIFFDYNGPISTNEARTNISTLTSGGFVKDASVAVYPNPTKNLVTISAKTNLKSVHLFDAQGRLLQTILEHKKSSTLDLSNKAKGSYFLKITTEKGSTVEKVIKE